MATTPDSGPTTSPDAFGPTVTDTAARAADAVTPGGAGWLKVLAPLAEIGATWGVRKVLDSAYRRTTGSEPPRAHDPEESLRRVLMWAAVSAAALAIVNVIIDRTSARYER